MRMSEFPIGNGNLIARIGTAPQRITTLDRLLLLLPVLMWVMAALITWLLVTPAADPAAPPAPARGHPLSSRAIELELPQKLGPSTEIQELRDAFARAVTRVDESEREMAGALDGPAAAGPRGPPPGEEQPPGGRLAAQHPRPQRRDRRSARGLCRHRPPRRRAVDRPPQPFRGDGGESRDRAAAVAVRARRRASRRRAGAGARAARSSSSSTPSTRPRTSPSRSPSWSPRSSNSRCSTCPEDPVEISLRRTSELTARLTLGSPVLVPDEADEPGKAQFERIVGGLAKQLRSTLDRKLGRYSVDLPVFPPIR